MKNRTHLFLACFPGSRGEITLAMNIAKDLHKQGDHIVFLIREEHSAGFSGTPYTIITIDSIALALDEHMTEIIQSQNADSLILADLHSNSTWLKYTNQGKWFFNQNSVPVLAIDCYNLSSGIRYGDAYLNQDHDVSYLSSVPCGVVTPVPFVNPDSSPNAYNALTPAAVIEEDQKRIVREELGIASDEKLVLLVGAKWQSPSFSHDIHVRKAAIYVPNLISYYLSRISNVRVVHIGPEPYHINKALQGRYLWLPQVDPKRYHSILASTDLFLTCNMSSNTLSSAITLNIPTIVLRNSFRVRTVDEALANIPGKASEALLNWLEITVPIDCFYNWPFGYYRLFTQLLKNNPYCDTFNTAELFYEDEFIEECHRLLYDENARHKMKDNREKYINLVHSLPRGADLIQKHLSNVCGELRS
jgi:hypothetical protein